MKIDIVNNITVSIIMLNQPLTSNIPDFYSLVLTTTCDTCSIRVELDCIDRLFVVTELVNLLSGGEIP